LSTQKMHHRGEKMTQEPKKEVPVKVIMDYDLLADLDRIATRTGINQRGATIRYLIAERARQDRLTGNIKGE